MLQPHLRPFAAALLAAGTLCSCNKGESAKPAASVSAVAEPAATPPRAKLPERAAWRWTGTTARGPAVAGGTLLLLGGRRALLTDKGELVAEKSPLPEAIEEIVVVPMTNESSATGQRVVARGHRNAYVLDDPLGEPVSVVRSELRLDGIAVHDGLVSLFAGGEIGWTAHHVAIDVVRAARSGSAALPPNAAARAPIPCGATKASAPILQWIDRTGRDPLAAAIGEGAPAPGGAAIVASHGLLARIDLATGDVLELLELAKSDPAAPADLTPDLLRYPLARVARAGDVTWLVQATDHTDQTFRVSRLDPEKALAIGPREIEVRHRDKNGRMPESVSAVEVSPSGGIMIQGVCAGDPERSFSGAFCVHQPDGTWATVRDPSGGFSAAGPLADGRVAFLDSSDEGHRIRAVDARGHAVRVAFVATERRLDLPADRGDSRRIVLVEAEDRSLALAFEDGHVARVAPHRLLELLLPPDGSGAMRFAELGAGRGVAMSPKLDVFVTTDNAKTWRSEGALRDLSEDVGWGGPIVTELGAVLGPRVRIGWGEVSSDVADELPATLTLTTAAWEAAPLVELRRHPPPCAR